MRIWIVSAAAAAMFATALPAAAADQNEKQPEFKAYVSLKFDGHGEAAQQLNYGLRMDHDRRFLDEPRPAIAQLDFRAGRQAGLEKFQLNGAPLVQRQTQLNQDGELQYGAIDWALVAAAAVGIGWIAYETFDNDESPDPTPDDETPIPNPPANTPVTDLLGVLSNIPQLGELLTQTLTPTVQALEIQLGRAPLVGDLIAILDDSVIQQIGQFIPGFGSNTYGDDLRRTAEIERNTPAYQAWLDGGTGHMGDLLSAH
ncbi:hypothetical protein D0B54_14785 [Solimonas sp. K1W22B-7]|uniref:hypothetical protein n=1 Tax=Solimonas sp. K1W22B-7 TaxID=2303331 RepID=UPI000E3312ED|nr:hypothetical protein [Solimonas sp. K1W22B-7]AXQ29864.1 hypothetical protein D0B54_14785 [Solimonas sp. K1W22B-7]